MSCSRTGDNAMTPVRLEPAAPLSRVKHSTTEPLRSQVVEIIYCEFENFLENFIFANSINRHFCDVRISRLVHDIRISVNDSVILPFLVGFNFTKLRICEVSRN